MNTKSLVITLALLTPFIQASESTAVAVTPPQAQVAYPVVRVVERSTMPYAHRHKAPGYTLIYLGESYITYSTGTWDKEKTVWARTSLRLLKNFLKEEAHSVLTEEIIQQCKTSCYLLVSNEVMYKFFKKYKDRHSVSRMLRYLSLLVQTDSID